MYVYNCIHNQYTVTMCGMKIGSKLRADCTGVTPWASPVSLSIANKPGWCLRIHQNPTTSHNQPIAVTIAVTIAANLSNFGQVG